MASGSSGLEREGQIAPHDPELLGAFLGNSDTLYALYQES
jgi:hypothetical protein